MTALKAGSTVFEVGVGADGPGDADGATLLVEVNVGMAFGCLTVAPVNGIGGSNLFSLAKAYPSPKGQLLTHSVGYKCSRLCRC